MVNIIWRHDIVLNIFVIVHNCHTIITAIPGIIKAAEEVV